MHTPNDYRVSHGLTGYRETVWTFSEYGEYLLSIGVGSINLEQSKKEWNGAEMNESFSYYKVEKHKNICHLQRNACNTLVDK